MSKCLKCGAALPPVGECPACAAAAASLPATPAVPGLLDKDISIDRRRTPESMPAVPGPAVPSFSDLARGPATPTPPGLIPRHAAPAAQPPPMPHTQVASPPPAMPQRTQTPPMMPRTQTPPMMPRTQTPPMMPQQAQASPRASVDDPDVTAPGNPPFAATARAASMGGDPDTTAPGSPPFAPAPSLAVPAAAQHAPPLSPEPTSASRQSPTPVPVVTFSSPSRMPPPPSSTRSSEELTPHLPHPTLPGAAPRNAAGVQEIHARPASLWRRMLSFTIDTAAIVGVAMLYITLASSIAGVKAPSSQGLTPLDSIAAWMHALKSVLLPGVILLVVLSGVYCAVAAFLWNGRTLGRLLLGLRLVDTHGLAPAPGRAIVRAMLAVVSFGLFLGGFWMALFDRRGQTLHDKLTSTFVVQPS